jgi:hypothetical protein
VVGRANMRRLCALHAAVNVVNDLFFAEAMRGPRAG